MGKLSTIQAETLAAALTGIRIQKRTIVFECTGNDAGREVKNIIVAVFAPGNVTKLGVQDNSVFTGGLNQGWEKFSATFGTKDKALACLTEISDAITALFNGGNDDTPLQSGNDETPLQTGSGSHSNTNSHSSVTQYPTETPTETETKAIDTETVVVLGAAAIIILLLL